MTGNTLLRVVEGVATVELVGYLVKELAVSYTHLTLPTILLV